MARPVLFVLAGVNGAGKSSIGGFVLRQKGLQWFNPDEFARELRAATRCAADLANSLAWNEGVRRLDEAVRARRSHAFETTLGGDTITQKLRDAAKTHDLAVWFCGLPSPQLHVARVGRRVAAGGHPIDDRLIHDRYRSARLHLIELLPHIAHLQVLDNSVEAGEDGVIPDPMLVLQIENRRITWPRAGDLAALEQTPEWAKAIVEAALQRPASPASGASRLKRPRE